MQKVGCRTGVTLKKQEEGNIDITILYPADYFDTKKVDEDYLPEWTEAGRFPEFHRLLYAYDSFASNGPLKVFPSSCPEGLCIYRGWMLQPSDYRRLYAGLKGLGLTLINSPEEYENCHEFPLSYEKLHGYTPKIRVYPDGTPIDWDAAKKDLGSFMMKDYVKSVKGSHFPSYFDGSWDNTQLDEAVRQFRSLRGGLFVKGIVLKQYVSLYRGAVPKLAAKLPAPPMNTVPFIWTGSCSRCPQTPTSPQILSRCLSPLSMPFPALTAASTRWISPSLQTAGGLSLRPGMDRYRDCRLTNLFLTK